MPTAKKTYQANVLKEYQRRINKSVEAYSGFLRDSIGKLDFDPDTGLLRDSQANQAAMSDIQAGITLKLTEYGFDSASRFMASSYATLTDYTALVYSELGYDVNPEAVKNEVNLNAVRKTTLDEFQTGRVKISEDVLKAFRAAQLGTMTMGQLQEAVLGDLKDQYKVTDKATGGVIGKLKGWGYTIANTGLMAADRQATVDTGKFLGVKWYEYQGGKYANTRDFCREILEGRHPNTGEPHGKWWRVTEIEKLDSGKGQPKPVLLHAGGYNCQHKWFPASMAKNRELEAQYGFAEEKQKPKPKPAAKPKTEPKEVAQPTAAGVTPQFKGLNEARSWAKKNLGIELGEDVQSLYAAQVAISGIVNLRSMGYKFEYRAIEEDKLYNGDAYAYNVGLTHRTTGAATNLLGISSIAMANENKLKLGLQKDIANGYHPQTKHVQSLIYHEAAHAMSSIIFDAKGNAFEKLYKANTAKMTTPELQAQVQYQIDAEVKQKDIIIKMITASSGNAAGQAYKENIEYRVKNPKPSENEAREYYEKKLTDIQQRYNNQMKSWAEQNNYEYKSNQERCRAARKESWFISGYAEENIGEFISEAFAAYVDSANPSPYAIEVGKIMDTCFKDSE